MRALLIDTFVPMLGTLSSLLGHARDHARAAGREPDALFATTLAPGMYGLGMQARVACDHALESVARITGQAPPAHAHGGDTLDAIQTEIASAIAWLRAVPAARFEGAAERAVVMPLQGELVLEMTGERFARDWALPLFYFHVVLAYGMLRHDGMDIGVQDYLAHIGDAVRPAP